MNVQIVKKEKNLIEYKDLESGIEFVIAKDSMGTQICSEGKFFPDSRDFGSVENAQKYLEDGNNLSDALQFFKSSPVPSTAENLYTVMFGIISQEMDNEDLEYLGYFEGD